MSNYNHQQSPKVGVLIANTGTPAAPTRSAVRTYLKQFLWDPRMVDKPRWLWWLILNGVILNIRPQKSARAYQRVWTERGSPLFFHTEDQALYIRKQLHSAWSDTLVVEWAMRYGEPSITQALDQLQQQGVEKLLVLPLFPQYASASTASIFDAVASHFIVKFGLPKIRFSKQYFDTLLYSAA